MRSFDHIITSGLKSGVIFEFNHPFSYTEAAISGTRHHFQRLCDDCLRMRSRYINSASGRKSVTGNGFSDIDFL